MTYCIYISEADNGWYIDASANEEGKDKWRIKQVATQQDDLQIVIDECIERIVGPTEAGAN